MMGCLPIFKLRTAIFFVLFVCSASTACTEDSSAGNRDSDQPTSIAAYQTMPCEPTKKHVEFENVSFDYDPCAFGNVKAKKVPDFRLQEPTDKPDEVAPEHLRFVFDKGPEGWEPFVEIYPVQRFREMYAVNKREARGVEQEVNDLKRVIKQPSLRFRREIPYLPYVEARQDFQAHVKASSTNGDNGIYFLTHRSIEVTLVCNDRLLYTFEGLTSDGKYYVLAELPVGVSFLPNDESELDNYHFENFSQADLWEMVSNNPYSSNANVARNNELSNRYESYLAAVTKRLEETKANDFTPSLDKLEVLVDSLKIKN